MTDNHILAIYQSLIGRTLTTTCDNYRVKLLGVNRDIRREPIGDETLIVTQLMAQLYSRNEAASRPDVGSAHLILTDSTITDNALRIKIAESVVSSLTGLLDYYAKQNTALQPIDDVTKNKINDLFNRKVEY